MNTRALIVRRLFHTIVTLFLVLSMMWALFRLVPGDPLVMVTTTPSPLSALEPTASHSVAVGHETEVS